MKSLSVLDATKVITSNIIYVPLLPPEIGLMEYSRRVIGHVSVPRLKRTKLVESFSLKLV